MVFGEMGCLRHGRKMVTCGLVAMSPGTRSKAATARSFLILAFLKS